MKGRVLHWLAGAAGLLVVVTRWPFRSHELFSWDSANYALAMAAVDIGAHRPHPPGYLGYVIAAEALDLVFRNPNLSLVVWNIVATTLAALVLIRFAWELAEDPRRTRTAVAASLMLTTSPLLWFYGEVAEIYPSELLVTLLVAFTAWRAIRGRDHHLYWCAGALALAALFKASSPVMMLPLALYAWTRIAPPYRWRSAALLGLLLGVVGLTFLLLQPDLPAVVWRHFESATAFTRTVVGETKVLKAFNRNTRDALTSTVSGLGALNFLALAFMAVFVRRLPSGLDRRLALLWALPCVLVVTTIHMGKPGYILPIVPLAILIIASWFAGLRRPLFVSVMVLVVVTNVIQFAWLSPPSYAAVEGGSTYRNKSIRARMLSDLQALTDPTAFNIRSSDHSVRQLRELVTRTCPQQNPIIVVRVGSVDWRRVMWYFPAASAIRVDDNVVVSIGTDTNMAQVPASGVWLTTDCPMIWLSREEDPPASLWPSEGTAVPGLGTLTAAGTVVVTPTGIRTIRSTS